MIPYLFEEIKKSGLTEDQIVFISFYKEVLIDLKTQAPQYKTFLLSSFKLNVFGKYTPSLDTVLTTLKAINADGFSSTRKKINQNFVNKVIAAGYKSITTDVPSEIRSGLSE